MSLIKLAILDIEAEIGKGIFSVREPRSHCLCYHREWKSFENLEGHDIMTTKSNTQVMQNDSQKSSLVEEIKNYLGHGNHREFYIEKSTQSKEKYLDELCEAFTKDVKQLVLQSIEQNSQMNKDQNMQKLYKEVLHHSAFASEKVACFCGQKETLRKMERYLQDPRQNTKPLLVHGPTGNGKTMLMAALTKKLHDWFGEDIVVVYRCLGTSSDSCNIKDTVKSIIAQICLVYGIKLSKENQNLTNLYDILLLFREVTDEVSKFKAFSKPLFMVLDGIDNLQPFATSLRALWAIRGFSPNVHLIVSSCPEVGKLKFTDAFASLTDCEDGIIEIEPISNLDAEEIINKYLENNHRTIEKKHMHKLIESFEKVPKPLFLSILAHDASKWKSYLDGTQALVDTSDTVNTLVLSLEQKFGKETIKYILSYLTVSSSEGIMEQEMLDLLAIKEEIQMELKENQSSKISFIWSFFKNVLKPFLLECLVHGKLGIAWSHCEYLHIIAKRYDIIYPGIDESLITDEATTYTLSLHEDIFNLYTNEKIVTGQHSLVSPQPTCPNNLIKLTKIVTHGKLLIPIHGLANIKKYVFFNFEWIQSMIQADLGVQIIEYLYSVLVLLRSLVESESLPESDDSFEDLEVLFVTLLSCRNLLENDHDSVPGALYTKLVLSQLSSKYESMQNLENSITLFVKSTKEVMLLPTYSCLSSLATGELGKISGPTQIVSVISEKSTGIFFDSHTGLYIYQSDLLELQHRIPTGNEQNLSGIVISNNKELIIVCHYSHVEHTTELIVWNILTGLQVGYI